MPYNEGCSNLSFYGPRPCPHEPAEPVALDLRPHAHSSSPYRTPPLPRQRVAPCATPPHPPATPPQPPPQTPHTPPPSTTAHHSPSATATAHRSHRLTCATWPPSAPRTRPPPSCPPPRYASTLLPAWRRGHLGRIPPRWLPRGRCASTAR